MTIKDKVILFFGRYGYDVCILTGAALVGVGLGLIFAPLALLWAGLFLGTVGYLGVRTR